MSLTFCSLESCSPSANNLPKVTTSHFFAAFVESLAGWEAEKEKEKKREEEEKEEEKEREKKKEEGAVEEEKKEKEDLKLAW